MLLDFVEMLKVIFLGIVEGITEWLPISSTGHMLLVDEFIRLDMTDSFKEMFFVVIQLGAILAVVLLFWKKMFPFQFKDKTQSVVRKDIFSLWFKVVAACIPGAVVTLLFDDYVDAHFHTPLVIAAALIFYGFAFILIENWNKKRKVRVESLNDITYQTAFLIGLFQVLAIIPGTSRSGSTIIGGILAGTSRTVAAEFTFFLGIPVMFGASLLKIVKYFIDGNAISGSQLAFLGIGSIVAFLVSIVVIKFLLKYIKGHDFKVFGFYRIVLGIILIVYMIASM